jgi:hypothetical protein
MKSLEFPLSELQKLAYRQSSETKSESIRCFLAALSYFGIPETLADVGCGEGHLVRVAAQLGIQSFGIDANVGSERFANGILEGFDLTRFQTFKKYEMVLCLEVAEHLPFDAANNFCSLLADMTERILIFSAAQIGQGGAGHLNEQPVSYWRKKLESNGLIFDPVTSVVLSKFWETVAPNAWWYSKNCQVFKCAK